MKKDSGLGALQIDAFRELVSIGSAKAAKSLAQMTGQQIGIEVPEVRRVPLRDAVAALGGAQRVVRAIHQRMIGGLSGRVLLCFEKETAHSLASLLLSPLFLGGEPTPDMETSALEEMGNIVISSVVNVLSELLGTSTFLSVPTIAEDSLASVVDFVLNEAAMEGDSLLMVEARFTVAERPVLGQLLLFPGAENVRMFLDRLTASVG
ncbi:MAG: chemotaxis protein CheC [Elusimicrobia bacterium]|nr:chemotaxis protein CheC [Elusimicrobiota bacterium]